MIFYRLGRYYLEKTDDMENAEWWLRKAADRGLELASYLVYKDTVTGSSPKSPAISSAISAWLWIKTSATPSMNTQNI